VRFCAIRSPLTWLLTLALLLGGASVQQLHDAAFDDVTHTVDSSLDATFAELVTGFVNEGGSLRLLSPTGLSFSDLIFASYGTPTGQAWPFVQSGCHAPSSRTVVATAFLGKLDATVAASNGNFGDPCGGTVKRLAVALAAPSDNPVGLAVNEPQALLLVFRDAAGQVDATFQGSATLSGSAGISGSVGPFLNGVLATTVTPTVAGENRTLVVGLEGQQPSVTLSFSVVSMVLSTQPVLGQAVGAPFQLQPSIKIVDGEGTALPNVSGTVAVAILSGDGGTLSGTTSIPLIAGVAQFADLALLGRVGEPYVLRFSVTGLGSVNSEPLVFQAPGPVVGLRVSAPTGGPIGSPQLQNIPFDVKLKLVDVAGNAATYQGAATTVALSASGGATTGELRLTGDAAGGTVSVPVAAGVSEVSVEGVLYTGVSGSAGADVVLAATGAAGGGLAGIAGVSDPFTVLGTLLSVSAVSSSLIANGTATTAITVRLTDAAPVPSPLAGQAIRVSTTAGTLLADNVAIGGGSDPLLTNQSGEVALVLRAGVVPGVAVVTALCPGACSESVSVALVEASAALQLTLSARLDGSAGDFGALPTVLPGDLVRFRLAFLNSGNDEAAGVELRSVLPMGFEVLRSEASVVCPGASAAVTSTGVLGAGAQGVTLLLPLSVVCGPVASGASGSVEFVVRVR